MKKYENLLQAMKTFRDSYHVMLTEISDYERITGESVNDVPGFTEYYPFNTSFDEFPIDLWVDNVVCKITQSTTRTEIYTSYIPNEDTTVIWQDLIVKGDCIQRSIVGWYFGEPNEEATKQYTILPLTAQFL